LTSCPKVLPDYSNSIFSPYRYVDTTERLESAVHFAPDVVDQINCEQGQEIGTHTFSHYYCLEAGQTKPAFLADLEAAVAIGKRNDLKICSLVFPRNQWNPDYLDLLNLCGIRCFRGNPMSSIYSASDDVGQSYLQRGLRLLDAYVNITGHHTFALPDPALGGPYDFPGSRFLRPWSRRLALLDSFRLKRILGGMTDAAQKGRVFHLWWHPHNFGTNLIENMAFLAKILAHFDVLKARYEMRSLNMSELCDLVDATHAH